MTWNSGYVTDITYLPGYYMQQAPAQMAAACLLGNVASDIPAIHETLSYMELGCGRGYGALALAASNPGWRVTGIDFHPAHIAEARLLAAAAGLTNITFHEADLATLADGADAAAIPMADVISMHGVWSWVAPPVQQGIVRLLQTRLRPGGVAHLSYNVLPGWQGGLAMQRLLFEAGARLAQRSDRQVTAALEVVQALHAAEARHLTRTPFGDTMVKRLGDMPVDYLAHEYMNGAWHPVFHADVVAALQPAKLEYVAAADLMENFPALMLTDAQRAVQDRFDDPVMRELIKDTCQPRSLRHDIFMRGGRRIGSAERNAALNALSLTLNVRPQDFIYEARLPAGTATLERGFYGPIVAALGEGPMMVGELLQLPDLQGERDNPAELVGMLVGTGQATVTARKGAPPAAPEARRFNRAAALAVLRSGRLEGGAALASHRLGAALPCLPVELVVLEMLMQGGEADPVAWATRAGMTPDSAAQFRDVSATLLETRLPVWRAAGVC